MKYKRYGGSVPFDITNSKWVRLFSKHQMTGVFLLQLYSIGLKHKDTEMSVARWVGKPVIISLHEAYVSFGRIVRG